MSNPHPWTLYIISRGLFLSCLLLAVALVLLVWGSAHPMVGIGLHDYAAYCQTSSIIVLATGLFGGLCLEDGLRKTAN